MVFGQKLNSKVYYYYYRFFLNRKYAAKKNIKYNESFSYEKLLNGFDIPPNSRIFIHAGIKSIKIASGREYGSVVSKIIDTIQTLYSPSAIIAPAFTPSFRNSGVFSKKYSKAEYGAFSEIFRSMADYRTDDAIHGCAIIGHNLDDFDKYDFDNTFGINGFYHGLLENTYIINISTNYFVSTYLHYLEADLKCPYKKKNAKWCGVMLDDADNIIEKVQINHSNLYDCAINRGKLFNKLTGSETFTLKQYGGMNVSSISVKDLDETLRREIINDPYFLVTF